MIKYNFFFTEIYLGLASLVYMKDHVLTIALRVFMAISKTTSKQGLTKIHD